MAQREFKKNDSTALIYMQTGKNDSAEKYFKRALTVSRQNKLWLSEISAIKSLSQMYRTQGKFNEAILYYDELEHKSKKAGLMDVYATSFSERGFIYWRKNDRVKTLEFMQKAAAIFEELKPGKESVSALIGIAFIYDEMKQPEKARELYNRIISLYHVVTAEQLKNKDFYGLSSSFLNLGFLFSDKLNSDSGLYYLARSIDVAKKNDLKKVLALAYTRSGVAYFRKKDIKRSESYFLMALQLYDSMNNKLGKSFVLTDLFKLYESTNRYEKMEPYLKEAIEINSGLGDSALLKDIYLNAAVLYEKRKDFETAYNYRKKYEVVNERLFNARDNATMNDMLAKYESAAKEKENKLLQKENILLQKEKELSEQAIADQKKITWLVIIAVLSVLSLIFFILRGLKLQRDNYSLKVKEQQVELVKLNEMKTLAELKTLQARINPHFLYNALNSITSLIHEKPEDAETMTIKLSQLFRYSINTQEANWSTVKEEINIVQTYLDIERVRFGDRINFSVEADENIGSILIPRFLLQPLVENALKHGLKNTGSNGVLSVKIKDAGDLITVNVHDNGLPFPNEMFPGYGLQSINDKLNLLCGSSWKMNFINEGEKRIHIELPKQNKV